MKEEILKSESLFAAYVARFGVEPGWNMQPIEQQIADMEEVLRLNRPMPEEAVDPDVLI